MKNKTKNVMISLYLETIDKMEKYCKENLIPKSRLINHLLNEHIDKKLKEK